MKRLITNYTFDASEKTITFGDYASIALEAVLLVTNVTDGVIVYNFADSSKGGSASNNVLTLEYNTTSMSDTDKLQIFYDDTTAIQAIEGTVTANLSATDNTVLDSIETAVEAIQAAQLPDSHNVTVDNTTIAVTQSGVWDEVGINDSGNSITVDGSVSVTQATAANLNTTEANSAAIRAAVETLNNAISGSEMQVDVVSSALPTGAATAANQSTIIGHVDGIETTLSAIDAGKLEEGTFTGRVGEVQASPTANTVLGRLRSIEDKLDALNTEMGQKTEPSNTQTVSGSVTATQATATNLNMTEANSSAIKTAVETIDNAIAGSEMQVDVVTMPTTTVQSTNLDIRDLSAATDSVAVHGDVGVIDQLDLTNSNPLAVAIVDGAGSQIASFGGGTQYTEGDTDTTITGTALLFESNTGTSALSAVSNITPLPVSDAGGALTVDGSVGVIGTVAVTQSGAWDEVGINDSGNSITVDGTVTANAGTGTFTVGGSVTANAGTNLNTSALALETGGNLAGAATSLALIDDTVYTDGAGTPSKAIAIAGTDGTNPQIIKTDASGAVQVDVESIAAGNNNIGDVDVASVVPGVAATNLGKAEDGGHTTGDVGVMALGVRQDTPNAAISGTNGDYTPLGVTSTGALQVSSPSEDFAALANGPQVKKYYTNAGAVTDGIVWSPTAGKRWYVTDIFVNVSAAATVTLEDDLAGGDSAVWKAELAANSGWSHSFSTPLFSGEDAADLLVTTSAGNVYITVTGYEI